MGLGNGLEVEPTEFANGVDVGGERRRRMENRSQFPVCQVHCCLPRRGKSAEKEVLGHEFSFRGRTLKGSLLAVLVVLMRMGLGGLSGGRHCGRVPSGGWQVAGGFFCRAQWEGAEGLQGS